MNTEQLIRELSRDVPRVSRHALARRIVIGLVAGGLATLLLVALLLGLRPDLQVAMQGFPFWMKWTYTASLGVAAAYGVARLSRPEPASLRGLWWLALPVLALAGIGAVDIANAPPDAVMSMWLGATWRACPLLVLLLAVPLFVGMLWAFRRLAPTRLRAAGAVAGLAAGAWAATLYCLHCPEVSALFVLTWYSLGIALAAGIGALLGPRLLRW